MQYLLKLALWQRGFVAEKLRPFGVWFREFLRSYFRAIITSRLTWPLFRRLHPNTITASRIPLGVIVVSFILSDWHVSAFVCLVLGIHTDGLDGELARIKNLVTDTGKWLDPFSDKLFFLPTLIALSWDRIPRTYLFTILGLEVLLILMLLVAKYSGEAYFKVRWNLGSNIAGQAKVAFQVMVVLLLFVPHPFAWDLAKYTLNAAILAAIFSLTDHLLTFEKI